MAMFEGMLSYVSRLCAIFVLLVIAVAVLFTKAAWCGVNVRGPREWFSADSDADPDVLNKPYQDAIKAYRDYWKRTVPIYVRRMGGDPPKHTIPIKKFDNEALYLWIDSSGKVVNGGSWEEIGEPLHHDGFVDIVPAIGAS